jgi:hypothetical protein
VVILHWQQFLALFGLGQECAEFAVRLRTRHCRGFT